MKGEKAMKTVKQAATERVNLLTYPHNKQEFCIMTHRTFVAGVAFAQRWIPVAEEMPEHSKQVLVKIECVCSNQGNREIKKIKVQIFSLGNYDEWSKKWSILHSLIEKKYHCESWEVTHWRPVELE